MKKVLLGTTALAALAFCSHGAFAQEPTPTPANSADQPIKLELGGYYIAGYGMMVQQDDHPGQAAYKHTFDGFQEDAEINAQGSTKLANGLQVGVRVQFRGENNGGGTTDKDQVHQNYVFFKHADLGELRVGDANAINILMGYQAPQVDPNIGFGTNTPSVSFVNGPIGSNTTTETIANKGTKFVYFTPSFSGFQLGLSYAPDGRKGNTGGATNAGTTYYNNYDGGATYRDETGVGANWKGQFGDINLGFEGHYVQAVAKQGTYGINDDGNADPKVMGGGFQAGYGPWSLGAAYEHGESIAPTWLTGSYQLPGVGQVSATAGNVLDGTLNHEVNDTFDVGVAYTVGPWRYGVAWSRGAYKGIVDGGDRTPKNNIIAGGAGYQVGPGIQLVGIVQFNDYDADGAAYAQPTNGSDVVTLANGQKASYFYSKGFDSTALIIGTDIQF